jgi:hypothetical protein
MNRKIVYGLLIVLGVISVSYTYFINTESTVPANTATTTPSGVATTTATTTPSTTTKPSVKPATTTPVTTPTTTPVTTTPNSNEIKITAYITGYAWPDNTPPGSDISNPIIHQKAGGTGTFTDPITVAVGHSFINGKDVLDYKAGTKFYLPYLHKYFIAEDTCGDGDTPQNGPCHRLDTPGNGAPAGAKAWLDIWVGGVGSTQSVVLNCENAVTDLHTVIINPASNYAVNAGAVYASSCAPQFSDTPTVH